MKSKNHKTKIRVILGFCITFLFIFTANTKAQIQELSPDLREQVLKDVEVTGRFNNDINTTKSGEPLTFILTIKNGSKSPIYFVDSFVERDYKITVKNERGETVSLTDYGKRETDPNHPIWRNLIVKLEPGRSMESRTGLDKIYNITLKEKYYVSVNREVVINRVVGLCT
ncbi:MAG: hypothetical protein ACR2N3_04320 [Pyrinomonadaceae bacterium]